jgi:hypothetical protein
MGKHDLIAKGLAAAVKAKDGFDALYQMNVAMFGENDPDTLFTRWAIDNRDRLAEAAADLGVTLTEGDGWLRRLQADVQAAWREAV